MALRCRLVVLAVLVVFAPVARGQRANGMFQQTLAMRTVSDVSVRTGAGRIEIRMGQPGRVEINGRITATKLPGKSQPSPEDRVRRVEAHPPVEQRGDSVHIGEPIGGAWADEVSISYVVTIPPGTRVRTKSGSGSQEIAADGDLDVSANSGRVRLVGVKGAVRASTSSGGIDIQGELSRDWYLSASSGRVSIALAGASPRFELHARTNSGGIEFDFPITVKGRHDRHEVRGTVGGGGPLIQVRTSSGRISIR